MTTLSENVTVDRTRTRVLRVPSERTLGWIALGAIVVLAAVLRLVNLDTLGYANHYYAAAVKAMLQSWHNFFSLNSDFKEVLK